MSNTHTYFGNPINRPYFDAVTDTDPDPIPIDQLQEYNPDVEKMFC